MTETVPTLNELADALAHAESTRVPIAPLSQLRPGLTVDEAYEVQQINVAKKLAGGARIIGRKVGLTSKAMQEQLKVDQPDYGAITNDMLVSAPTTVDVSVLISSRVEGEFAFRTGARIPAGIYTRDQLRELIDQVYVSMEIIDSRIADWKIGLVDTIADNASSARLVVGQGVPATAELLDALPDTTLELVKDGEPLAAGPGSAVLGDPLLGALWVVNRLGELGEDIEAGEIILAGAVHASVPLTPGSTWTVQAHGFIPATIETAH